MSKSKEEIPAEYELISDKDKRWLKKVRGPMGTPDYYDTGLGKDGEEEYGCRDTMDDWMFDLLEQAFLKGWVCRLKLQPVFHEAGRASKGLEVALYEAFLSGLFFDW